MYKKQTIRKLQRWQEKIFKPVKQSRCSDSFQIISYSQKIYQTIKNNLEVNNEIKLGLKHGFSKQQQGQPASRMACTMSQLACRLVQGKDLACLELPLCSCVPNNLSQGFCNIKIVIIHSTCKQQYQNCEFITFRCSQSKAMNERWKRRRNLVEIHIYLQPSKCFGNNFKLQLVSSRWITGSLSF